MFIVPHFVWANPLLINEILKLRFWKSVNRHKLNIKIAMISSG